MTIISPKKRKKYSGFFIKLSILVIVGVFVWINQYNSLADTRYQIRDMEESIASMEVENAELKNELYEITDPSNLEDVANSEGLVLDNNPKYLNLNQWVSDSSF